MFDFFPQIVIILSIAVIVVILARAFPRLEKVKIDKEREKKRIYNFFRQIYGFFQKVAVFSKKIIHILKIVSFNFSQKIYHKIKRIREERKAKIKAEKERKELTSKSLGKEGLKLSDGSIPSKEIINLQEKAKKFLEEKNFPEAEKIYLEIIKRDPQNIDAYKGLGQVYLKQNNLKDAKASFEYVLKIKPDDKEAKIELRVIESKMPR